MKKSLKCFIALITTASLVSISSAAGAASYDEGGGNATGLDSLAIGIGTLASNRYANSIGYYAQATGEYSSAYGVYAKATGNYSVAIGRYVTASGSEAMAFGGNNTAANGEYSFAGGREAIANGKYSTALGNNVKAGSMSTDEGNTAIGYNVTTSGRYSTGVGHSITVEGIESSAFGRNLKATGDYSLAVGHSSSATNERSTAIGYSAESTGSDALAVGVSAKAKSTYSVAYGYYSQVGETAANSVAVGYRASVRDGAGNSSAFGNEATVDRASSNSLAIGYKAKVNMGLTNAVAIGSNAVASESNTISIGSSTTQRRLVNLMAGRADTDAVNVSQLKGLNDLLGGSTLTGGKWGEKFKVGEDEYDSVADAISSLAGGSDNSVLYDGDDKSAVTLGGTNGTTIDKVAAGNIASGSMQAVNGGQLFTTNTNLSNLGASIADAFGGDFKFENGALTGGITYGDETTIQGAFDSIRDELDKLSEGWTFNPVDDSQQSGGAGTGDGAGTPPASSTIKPGDSLTVNAGDDINITQNGDKDYTISVDPALREEIEEGYTAADDALKMEITEAYKDADKKLEASITEAYQQADSELKAGIDKNAATIGEIGSVLGGAENGYKKPMFDTVTANDINVGKINISGSGINMGGADINTGGGNIDMGGGRITNLAPGAIAPGSTDAVTGGQLWEAYNRMDDLGERINVVGAHAAALSGLHPIQYDPYEPTTLSAAVGAYRDEYAVAVGVFHYVRENVLFNMGASLCSDGDIMGRMGVSFAVGRSSDKPKVAATIGGLRKQVLEMQKELEGLRTARSENKAIKAELASLREKNESSEKALSELATLREKNERSEKALRENEKIMKQNAELIKELMKRLEAKK
ncbi:YadA-like family protein [Cloacibacillus sp. An23]|uniref:YadA-like family protein n=1 Tax=Cloacibacillus sp. An23 TaxID=1965591 RepID=UPI000B3A6F8F|nr:YadA-like family protein [Cloacibacillus sp. An23]OUO95201.1 hypothetical protein B5F39_01340 [Cloacibacillus sp. An23]